MSFMSGDPYGLHLLANAQRTDPRYHQQVQPMQQYQYTERRPMAPVEPIPLECGEDLGGRESPDLWPEPLPGTLAINRENGLQSGPTNIKQKFRTEMDQEDVRLVNELGRLSADQLMEYVRNLQNNAFVLGVEEKKQFGRGKFLKIFEKRADQVY